VENRALAVAALTAALVCGCRKTEEKPAPVAPGVSLAAPDPSGTIVGSRLSKSSSSYTNEMQAEYLQNQASQLGIQRLGSTNSSAADSQTPAPTISYAEGLERTKELEAALANQRRQIDRNKPKSVDLPGTTPRLLQDPGSGGAPAPEAAP
jgi:hypothetical protein